MISYHFSRLEERVLLDGSIGAVVSNPAANDSTPPVRILVLASDTPQEQAFANNVKDNVQVVVFDPKNTSLSQLEQQIAAKIPTGEKATSIGFINRAGPSQFALSTSTLISPANLSENVDLQKFWSDVGGLMSGDGQIDLLVAGNINEGILYGLQALTNSHVSQSSTLTGSDLLGGDAGNGYFDDAILANEVQLVTLLHSSQLQLNDSGGSITPPMNTSIPITDLVQFNITLSQSSLTTLVPAFTSDTLWQYTISPNQDGSLNIFLALKSDVNINFDSLGTSAITSFVQGLSKEVGVTASQGLPGPVLDIHLTMTRTAFSAIQTALENQNNLSFDIGGGDVLIAPRGPGDVGSITPGESFFGNLALANTGLIINEQMHITLFNSVTHLITGFGYFPANGFPKASIFEELGKVLHEDDSTFFFNRDYEGEQASIVNSIEAYKSFQAIPQNPEFNKQTLPPNRPEYKSTYVDPDYLVAFKAALNSAKITTFNSRDNDSHRVILPESGMTLIDQHMQNRNQPFFPESEKLLHASPPIENSTFKGVIGALTWAEFKIDGGQNSIPKESKLIKDFPPKTPPQVQPGGSISEQNVLPMKDGKGFFGLKD